MNRPTGEVSGPAGLLEKERAEPQGPRSATAKQDSASDSSAAKLSAKRSRAKSSLASWLRPLLALLVLLGGVGFVAYRYLETAGQVPAELTLLGNVDVRQVNLSFKVGGRIASLMVDEGDAVEAGQRIATLDRRYFEDDLKLAKSQYQQASANLLRLQNGSRPEEIEQARAQEENARAALARAAQDFERSKQLISQKAISTQEFDANQAVFLEAQAAFNAAQASRKLVVLGPREEDIAAGQAQVDAAATQVQIAERRLTDAVLTAPHAGVILTRAREAGAIVNAGESVATLTLSSPVWIRTYIGEQELGNIEPGMRVEVTTDTVSGRDYVGRVGFISPTAEFTPKSVETLELRTSLVYRLRIVVDDPDGGLRQGMPVTVSVDLPGMRSRTFEQRLLEALGLGGVL